MAVGAEQLDAVVLKGVVRGRDHHPDIGAQGRRQHGDGGRRQRADQNHVHTHGDETGGQRRLQQIAGQAGILANHDSMAMGAAPEIAAGRRRQRQRGCRGHRFAVGDTANAVSAEECCGSCSGSASRTLAVRCGFLYDRRALGHPEVHFSRSRGIANPAMRKATRVSATSWTRRIAAPFCAASTAAAVDAARRTPAAADSAASLRDAPTQTG